MFLVVVKECVHRRFHRSGSIRSRRVAVDPALGVDDIGDRGPGATDGKFVTAAGKFTAFKILNQRIDLVFAVHHEFNIVAGRKTEITVTMFFGYFTDFTNMGGAHQTGTSGPYGKYFITGFGNVYQYTGLDNIMIQPFAFIRGNYRWIKFIKFFWTDVTDAVFHRFVRIIT